MSKLIKLSPTQAACIRDAERVTINGRTTVRAHRAKGVNYRTWNKLFEFGLIVGAHAYANLTEAGFTASESLKADPQLATVEPGKPSRVAYVAPDAEAPAPGGAEEEITVRVTTGDLGCDDRFEVLDRFGDVVDEWTRPASFYPIGGELRSHGIFNVILVDLDADGRPTYTGLRKVDVAPTTIGGMVRVGRFTETDGDPRARVRFQEALVAAWPVGARVKCVDRYGNPATGTVSWGDHGIVLTEGHGSFGRAYVGVVWDRPAPVVRSRVFVDELTRL